MNRSFARSLFAFCFSVFFAIGANRSARAHVGPPFPILADQKIAGYVVTIWADPDIGEALFYVVLEPVESQNPPVVSQIELSVEPITGSSPKKTYPTHQQKARGHLRFVATPEFATQEFWKIGAEIQFADGTTHALLAQVESTPPGLGRWDLLVYLVPFVLFGGLWAAVFVRKSRAKAAQKQSVRTRADIADPPSTVYYD